MFKQARRQGNSSGVIGSMDCIADQEDTFFIERKLNEAEKCTKNGFTLDNLERVPFLLHFDHTAAAHTVRLDNFQLRSEG